MAAEDQLISKQEWRWVWIFGTLAMLITSLPYLYAFAREGSSTVFTGFLIGVEDGNSYIAKMLRGSYGEWLFTTSYTAYPQTGILAYLPYLLLGKLAAPPGFHEQLVVLFHLYRFIAGICSIAAGYFFISIFISQVSLRRLAVVLLTFGGGLGWLILLAQKNNLAGSPPLEFFSPESFGFLEYYSLPHLSVARGLMLAALGIYLLKGNYDKVWLPAGILTGIILLVLGTLQPATLAVVLFLIAGHILLLKIFTLIPLHLQALDDHGWTNRIKFYCVTAGISLPYLLYTFLNFRLDPALSSWLDQNILTSPHPVHYIFAYGLMLPFVVFGAVKMWRSQQKLAGLFLIFWLFSLPLLAYSPITIQRRLVEGIWAAWVILAVSSFESTDIRIKRWKPVLWFMLPSTIIILIMGITSASSRVSTLFLAREEVHSFDQLAELAQPDDVLLSAYQTGNHAPAWLPMRVVIGHGPESSHLAELLPKVTSFYANSLTQGEQRLFLYEFSIDYIFWGPSEKALGNWSPDPHLYQRVIDGDYSVYRVLQQEIG